MSNIEQSIIFDSSMNSLPNTSLNDGDTECTEHTKIIEQLSNDLLAANNEIENLALEIMSLKNELDKRNKIIEMYKKIESSNYITPNVRKGKRNKICDQNRSYCVEVTPIKQKTSETNNKIINFDKTESPSKLKEHSELETKTVTDHYIKEAHSSTKKTVYPKRLKDETTAKNQTDINLTKHTKSKIIILADQQGRGLEKLLQKLVGNTYNVLCFWKPGAALNQILETIDLSDLHDYVILLAGTNDKNPCKFQTCITNWLYKIKNTNLLISEIPYNKTLHEIKL